MITRAPRPCPDLFSAADLPDGLRAAVRFFLELEARSFSRMAQELAPLIAARLEVALQPTAVIDALLQSSGLVALEAFCGDWLGRWGDLDVEHRWGPVVPAPRELEVSGFRLRRVQYAWVGDGYGYNYEVTRAGARVLLGAVFHLEPAPSDVVAYLTPHVGVVVAGSRVVWLTPQHLFFERVDPVDDRYSIAQYSRDQEWIYETSYHRPGGGSHLCD